MELEAVFDTFADATEQQLARMAEEIRGLRSTLEQKVEEVRSLRGEIETRAAVSGPMGERGEPGPAGRDGVDGLNGRDGKDGVDGKDGAPSTVPGPQGERGERGADSTVPGPKGDTGERGADGLNGRDGAPSLIPGPPGPQGERGADGIATLEELDARIEARFAELQVRTFADLYQGVFEPSKTYTRGVLATWGGSLWMSVNNTSAKPGENNADWKLVVKRGADGRK